MRSSERAQQFSLNKGSKINEPAAITNRQRDWKRNKLKILSTLFLVNQVGFHKGWGQNQPGANQLG